MFVVAKPHEMNRQIANMSHCKDSDIKTAVESDLSVVLIRTDLSWDFRTRGI